jgi:hypothetical protein
MGRFRVDHHSLGGGRFVGGLVRAEVQVSERKDDDDPEFPSGINAATDHDCREHQHTGEYEVGCLVYTKADIVRVVFTAKELAVEYSFPADNAEKIGRAIIQAASVARGDTASVKGGRLH